MDQESTLDVVDLGDACDETKQQGPGPYFDSVWGWGYLPGYEQ